MRRVAIMQLEPIANSIELSVEKMLSNIDIAAKEKAKLIVFGESWLCGYPAWIDYAAGVAQWDNDDVKEAWLEMYKNAISITDLLFDKIKEAAKTHNITIVLGCNERIDTGKGNNSLYNSILIIDKHGQLANHHRKLMPTYNEKLIHALGDGSGLQAVDTDLGRIGALICWEHWMPLTRQAMHDEAEDIHIALWPHVIDRHLLASRHYAFEGRCYVLAVGQLLRANQFPNGLKTFDNAEEYVLKGGSCLIGPDGNLLSQQVIGKEEIIYVDIPSNDVLIKERMNLAVSGHYQRDDVFDFKVDKTRRTK